jgi:hypothetical protein
MFGEKKFFWVIFDTCQRPQYYQDLHNLIALPAGACLRYDYKDKYLSAAAQQNLNRKSDEILFIYAQKNGAFIEKDNFREADSNLATIFIATRIGRMLNISKDAESNYFDFTVEGYPSQDEDLLSHLLQPLIKNNDTPWKTWIATSTDVVTLKRLKAGDDSNKWASIVQRLGTAPMQFSQDGFWRLSGPFRGYGARAISSSVETLDQHGATQSRTFYTLLESASHRFVMTSDAPRGTLAARQLMQLTVSVSDAEVAKVLGTGVYPLRQYTSNQVEFSTKPAAAFGSLVADLVFKTNANDTSAPSVWPQGANFTLRLKLRLNRIRFLSGLFSGTVGLILVGLFQSKLFDNDQLDGALILIVGLLLAALSAFLLTGKVTFKG